MFYKYYNYQVGIIIPYFIYGGTEAQKNPLFGVKLPISSKCDCSKPLRNIAKIQDREGKHLENEGSEVAA